MTAATTGLLAVSAVAGLEAPASAALSSAGAVDPATLFPSSYSDTNGLALSLCLSGDANCLAGPDFVDIHKQGGDAEAFYYAADAEVGGITVHNALEAAYAADGDGQEVVFMRTQVAAQSGGLVRNAEYTITDPYGVLTCTSNADGEIRNNACRTETTPVPEDFTIALRGRIDPFLTWDTYADRTLGAPPPAGYIGDNVTPHKVMGSPTGFNKVRVEGPGFDGTCTNADGTTVSGCEETDLFIVQGKVQPGASAALSATRWDFGNVAASAPATKSFSFSNTSTDGTALNLSGVTTTGSTDFTAGGSCTTVGTLAPGTTCTLDISYTPVGSGTDSGRVTIASNLGDRTIDVTGRSVGVPHVDTPGLAFGGQGVGTTSVEDNVVIGNSGVAASNLTSVEIAGASKSHFALGSTNTCATPIEPGQGCELGVVFAPTTAGAKSATLQLFFDGATTNPLTVPLSGTGMITAPGAPSGLVATPGDASATVTWDAPSSNGGAAITGYELTVRNAAGAVVQTVTPATSPQSLTGLANGTTYTVEVQARNSVGLSAAAHVTVRPAVPDLARPTLTARTPSAGAKAVAASGNVTATFSEPLDATTIGGAAGTVTLTDAAGAAIPSAVTYNATTRVATLNPTANLAQDTTYTVSLSGGIRDLAGNELAPVTWTFTTGPAPTLTARTPAPGATAVSRTANVNVTFSEAITGVPAATGRTATVRLRNAATGANVAAAVSFNATTRVLKINPSATLAARTRYTVQLTKGLKDLAGNPLTDVSWSFTTGKA